MNLSFNTLAAIQIGFILLGLRWYLRRNDEVPLLASLFLLYVASFRFWSVMHGFGKWGDISNFGFAVVDTEAALEALNLIVLGQGCLIGAYMSFQKRRIPVSCRELPRGFVRWLRPKAFGFALVSIPIVHLSRAMIGREMASGKSLGFQVSSYVSLLPMMLVGVACLLILLWKFGAFPETHHRWVALGLIVALMQLTFNPTSRFLFLGWLLSAAVIITLGFSPQRRLLLLSGTLALAGTLFAVAGAMRNQDNDEGLHTAAWDRAVAANDANMLDGFVLLRQVYPERLAYDHGMEHLEILMRPIPRSLWPGKPVGGYMNKLGLVTAESGFNLGISPTLFGSFYQEGGVWAIILISLIYGVLIARLVIWSTRLHPFAGTMIRALLCAALVPLLRGGDLPGIYAWFGMAFWPCLLLLWVRRRELVLGASAERSRSSRGRSGGGARLVDRKNGGPENGLSPVAAETSNPSSPRRSSNSRGPHRRFRSSRGSRNPSQ